MDVPADELLELLDAYQRSEFPDPVARSNAAAAERLLTLVVERLVSEAFPSRRFSPMPAYTPPRRDEPAPDGYVHRAEDRVGATLAAIVETWQLGTHEGPPSRVELLIYSGPGGATGNAFVFTHAEARELGIGLQQRSEAKPT